MAFYLLIPPTTAAVRVVLGADISQTASGNFEIEFEVDIFGTNGIIAADNVGNGQNLIFFTTLTNLQLRIANSQRNFTLPQSAAGRHVYRIVSNTLAGNIQVFQDGVSCGTTAGNNFFAIGRIADLNNQAARHFGLYYLTVRDSANTLINHYNPSASNGTGSTLIDTVGGNNGTLVNFPSDNSQWVFYDDGGGAFEYRSTVSFGVGLFSAEFNQSSTVPEYGSSVSFGVGLFSVSVSQSYEAPQYNSSLKLGVTLFSASVLQNSQPPEHQSSINFGVPLFSIAATQESTVPEFNSLVEFGVPLFGALISQQPDQLTYNSSAQVSIPLFGVSANQNSSVPEYLSSLSFGIPLFGVSIMAGDFEYFSDPSAGVDIINLSRSADVSNLSRSIDIVSMSRSIDI